MVSGFGQRDGPDAGVEVAPHPSEGAGAQLRVAAFELGIELLPEFLQHAAQEFEAGPQSAQRLLLEQRLGEPGGDLQIFGLRRQRFAGQFDDERPVSDLARALPVALVDVLLLAARLLDLVVDRIVAEVRPRRIRARDRLQQVFPQRHGGSAGRGGRQRNVELAQFENREWLVVHEEQLLAHRDRRAVL